MSRNRAKRLDLSDASQAIRNRFIAMLSIPTDPDACWTWTGYTNAKGYGQVSINGKTQWTHRVSYAMHVGPIRARMTVHHACLNTSCANPAHLMTASLSANTIEGNRRRAAC